MAQMMFNDRLAEIARRPDAKFLGAGAGTESITPEVEAFVISVRAPDEKIEEGMTAVAVEAIVRYRVASLAFPSASAMSAINPRM